MKPFIKPLLLVILGGLAATGVLAPELYAKLAAVLALP